nr:hypothetical protein [uncultured Ottowia sp.]
MNNPNHPRQNFLNGHPQSVCFRELQPGAFRETARNACQHLLAALHYGKPGGVR